MKFLIDNWMLISLALTSGGLLLSPAIASGTSGGISPAAAVHLINREKAVVIDVAEPEEFAASHVTSSKNVPLGQLEAVLSSTVKNKSLPLIMVCPAGARAARAVPLAKKLGFENVQVLAGGLKAWKAADLPLEKA